MCHEFHGARGGNRTPMARKGLGILSPVRLPVPPPGRTWKTYHKNSGVRQVVGKDFEFLSTPLHKYGNVFVRATRCPGAAGGSYERGDIPISSRTLRSVPPKGGNCVERNGSERSEVASVANRKPPASPGHREGKRLRASARYETVFTRHSTKAWPEKTGEDGGGTRIRTGG